MSPDLRRARMSAADRRELAALLYETKRKVYVETLNRLADEHGYTGSKAIIAISRTVDRALRDESAAAAASVVDTHNAAMNDWARDLPVELTDADFGNAYARWLEDRNRWHAGLVARTEAYNPYVDATIAFWRDVGVEVEYDFLGHNGSHEASCVLCQALVASNPHSAAEARAIGSPHPNCVHAFAAREPDLSGAPSRITLGREPGGVLGTASLLQQFGNDRRAAAAALRGGLVGSGP